MKKLFPLFLFFVLAFAGFAQPKLSWKKHVKLADEFYAKTLYTDAAEHYEAAWRQKPKKKDIINKAAECYYIIKDYKKAAAAFQNVKDEHSKFPLAGLRYARCLKQDGNYDEASREFVYFLNNYNAADKPVLSEIVQNEIRGCELGIKLSAEPAENKVQLMHLNNNVNSPETEFAPIPFTDDVLYYSSTMSNKARIYFTMREKGGDWKKSAQPKNFPDIPNEHFCNGTLTPDNKRFYFTICQSQESWGGLTTRCEINVIKKIGDTWTTPLRLRDYINLASASTTHPFVVHKNGKEILYFASNREGSIGGMDLWYTERNIDSDDIDFTFPVNLGPQINTLGDEITPFYDSREGVLYFSSNGQVSLGGQDIFKSKGELSNWAAPENAGAPFNSPTDDFYFTLKPSGHGGFFVSNRIFGMEKLTTTHEDLFEFEKDSPAMAAAPAPSNTQPEKAVTAVPDTPKPADNTTAKPADMTKKPTAPVDSEPLVDGISVLKGMVFDRDTDEPISGAAVSLYEVMDDGRRRLLIKKNSVEGKYEFALLSDQNFYLEASMDGYVNGSAEFSTKGGKTLVNEDIFIKKFSPDVAMQQEKPVYTEPKPEPKNSDSKEMKINKSPKNTKTEVPVKNEESTVTEPAPDFENYDDYYIARGQSSHDKVEFKARAPRHQGEYFKVQLIAIDKFNAEEARFKKVADLGRFDTEFILDKKLSRVLLADFYSMDEAKQILKKVKSLGFPRAFIVHYKDGERYGMIYR